MMGITLLSIKFGKIWRVLSVEFVDANIHQRNNDVPAYFKQSRSYYSEIDLHFQRRV